MSAHAHVAGATPGGRSLRAPALVVVLAAAVAAILSAAIFQHGAADRGPAARSAPFAVDVPSGWRALDAKARAAMPSHPVAVIRRADDRGLVVVRRAAPVSATGPQLVAAIGRRLRSRFPGFEATGARVTRVRGGRAFVYTFLRGHGRTVQSLALVSTGGKAYAIDTVVPGDAPGAAREAAAIVRSFGPPQR